MKTQTHRIKSTKRLLENHGDVARLSGRPQVSLLEQGQCGKGSRLLKYEKLIKSLAQRYTFAACTQHQIRWQRQKDLSSLKRLQHQLSGRTLRGENETEPLVSPNRVPGRREELTKFAAANRMYVAKLALSSKKVKPQLHKKVIAIQHPEEKARTKQPPLLPLLPQKMKSLLGSTNAQPLGPNAVHKIPLPCSKLRRVLSLNHPVEPLPEIPKAAQDHSPPSHFERPLSLSPQPAELLL